MRVIITGGRTYDDYEKMYAAIADFGVTEIAHGCARGADTLANTVAHFQDIPCMRFPAEWALHNRAAGPIRNQRMLDMFKPDAVMAFKGGRGTSDMVSRAVAAGVRVIDVDYTEDGARNTPAKPPDASGGR